jgi:hypothetical protein
MWNDIKVSRLRIELGGTTMLVLYQMRLNLKSAWGCDFLGVRATISRAATRLPFYSFLRTKSKAGIYDDF